MQPAAAHLICLGLVALDFVLRTWRTEVLLRPLGIRLGFREVFVQSAIGETASAISRFARVVNRCGCASNGQTRENRWISWRDCNVPRKHHGTHGYPTSLRNASGPKWTGSGGRDGTWNRSEPGTVPALQP